MKYGSQVLPLRLPSSLAAYVFSPRRVPHTASGESLVAEALESPIGMAPLKDLAAGKMRVALVVDDATRPTPIDLMLPPVLMELSRAGVASSQIEIVIALGTHRPMTSSEVRGRLGSAVSSGFGIVNADCRDGKWFRARGNTAHGVPVLLNRAVAEADLIIGLGMIAPHTDTGFSGGAKIILPGVCGLDTITEFHTRQVAGPPVRLGNQAAPLRLALEQFVAEQNALHFILNVILDLDENIFGVVAGHPVHAHRHGCRIAKDVYGIAVEKTYPVVVTNAYPTQTDLWQSTKALSSASAITSPGGHMILLAHCPEGLGTHIHYAEYIGQPADRLKKLLEDGDSPDPLACALALDMARIKAGLHISVVSSGLHPTDIHNLGFARFETLEEAIQNACDQSGASTLGILTHGGVCWPYLALQEQGPQVQDSAPS